MHIYLLHSLIYRAIKRPRILLITLKMKNDVRRKTIRLFSGFWNLSRGDNCQKVKQSVLILYRTCIIVRLYMIHTCDILAAQSEQILLFYSDNNSGSDNHSILRV